MTTPCRFSLRIASEPLRSVTLEDFVVPDDVQSLTRVSQAVDHRGFRMVLF